MFKVYFFSFLLISNLSFASTVYKNQTVEITTSGGVFAGFTKEVNIYGESAKELYDFLNSDEKSESGTNWINKWSDQIICGQNTVSNKYYCTIYVGDKGLED